MSRTSKIFVTVDVFVTKQARKGFEILLIQRKNDPFRGQWALPGGFVDEGEDLPDAARRELKEETGLDVKSVRQLGAFGKPGRDPRHHTVSVVFLADAGENPEIEAGDDAAAAQWHRIDELPELAFDHFEIVKAAREFMGI